MIDFGERESPWISDASYVQDFYFEFTSESSDDFRSKKS